MPMARQAGHCDREADSVGNWNPGQARNRPWGNLGELLQIPGQYCKDLLLLPESVLGADW